MLEPPRMVQGAGQGEPRAHGEADQAGPADAQMVQQGHDVGGHVRGIIVGRVVGAHALPVPAQVEGDAPLPPRVQGRVPAGALPALPAVGGKAVDQDPGGQVRGTGLVIGQSQACLSLEDHARLPSAGTPGAKRPRTVFQAHRANTPTSPR